MFSDKFMHGNHHFIQHTWHSAHAQKIETVTDRETEKVIAGLEDKIEHLKILNGQNLIITEKLDYIFSCYKLTVQN